MVKSTVEDLRSNASSTNNKRLVASYNQTEGNFILNLQCSKYENVSVIIIDAAGKTIHSGYMQVMPGANNISYNAGTLPLGIYYMQVTANDKTVNDKFVVAG